MKCTPGEDALKVVEMTTKDLESDIHLVETAVAGYENDSNFERNSTVKGRVNRCSRLH